MIHYAFRAISLMSLAFTAGCWCPPAADIFVREVTLEVRDATSQPAASAFLTLEPTKENPGDIRPYRTWLDSLASFSTSTGRTDTAGRATIPLVLSEHRDNYPRALLRVRRDTYFGYSAISLEPGARVNLGSMAVEIISIGPRIPYDGQRGSNKQGPSLRWKGDHGYSK